MRRILFGAISLAMIWMLVLMLSILVQAQTPADLLTWQNKSTGTISLSGLSPTSAWAIADSNANLTAWKDRPLADIGKYFSGMRTLDNGQAGVPTVLINFSKSDVPITPSIDTEVGNETPIATEDEGMEYY